MVAKSADDKFAAQARKLDQRQNKLAQDQAAFRVRARKQRTRILIAGGQMLDDTGLLDLPREELLEELRTLSKSIEKRRAAISSKAPSVTFPHVVNHSG